MAYTARLLRALADDQGGEARLADLVDATGLERATVNRIGVDERLAELTGDTCFLMVRSGQDAACIDRR